MGRSHQPVYIAFHKHFQSSKRRLECPVTVINNAILEEECLLGYCAVYSGRSCTAFEDHRSDNGGSQHVRNAGQLVTDYNIPHDSHLYTRCRENMKSYSVVLVHYDAYVRYSQAVRVHGSSI